MPFVDTLTNTNTKKNHSTNLHNVLFSLIVKCNGPFFYHTNGWLTYNESITLL